MRAEDELRLGAFVSRCPSEPSVTRSGHLDKFLARPFKVAGVERHAALPFTVIGDFMQRLEDAKGMGARALKFAILTVARSGEVTRSVRSSSVHRAQQLEILPG
jgi:hypothetical protein